MSITAAVFVRDLNLDLSNYRTVPQPDEIREVKAMISIRSDWFWELTRSLMRHGYVPAENIIVLDKGGDQQSLVVKEGNRRVAALKLALGILPLQDFNVPDDILSSIAELSDEWKAENEKVPCTIFSELEAAKVDQIVARTHGYGEKAGRAEWTAVARARHNRDAAGANEPALDLLEKYLREGRNFTLDEQERWAGDYNFTVLDEALPKIPKRIGVNSTSELAKLYPAVPHKDALDDLLVKIGRGKIGFKDIRDGEKDFAESCGFPPLVGKEQSTGDSTKDTGSSAGSTSEESGAKSTGSGAGAAQQGAGAEPGGASGDTSGDSSGSSGQGGSGAKPKSKEPKTVPITDQRTVKRLLKQLQPTGTNRAKLVTLRDEARNLDLDKNPIAFCFILRSMFEVSAKAYCDDHKATGGPSAKKDGKDKELAKLLSEIVGHLTQHQADQAMVRVLHGAGTELARPNRVLSVTSLNQLVHSPTFSITAADICVMFGNIFPLLDAMNK